MNLLRSAITGAAAVSLLLTTQAASAQKLMLGIKAGANMDKTSGEHLDSKYSGYFLVGAYTGIKFSKLKVQGEVLFSQSQITTGNNFTDAFGNYITDNARAIGKGDFKMNELSIPITVGINVVPKLLWIHAGPQYTGVVSINDVDGFVKETKNVFKNGYLSGVVGAELELPFSLNAGLRYVFGISDRNNTDVSESWRTSYFQLHVGFSFL